MCPVPSRRLCLNRGSVTDHCVMEAITSSLSLQVMVVYTMIMVIAIEIDSPCLIDRLIHHVLTLPVSITTTERAFSSIKNLKTKQ
ncbi:hypothetical protein MTR_6g012660 [Medicago truncatula]|uniref:HAT C-terminal dimerisation domain-containing protein n=1 Tax=Medicago truncatula TaxID=3880 RepID=G7KKX4_MEDTR|nr:hypothetical protein MTR_6g012660 [Medicago truncatula]